MFCSNRSMGRRWFRCILLLLGVRCWKRWKWREDAYAGPTEEEIRAWRAKRKKFLEKLDEAFDVWDEDLQDPKGPANKESD
jgi:hypothetical protein